MTYWTHPAKKIDQVDSENKDMGVVLHVQEEVYQSTLTFRRRVAGDHPAKIFDSLVLHIPILS